MPDNFADELRKAIADPEKSDTSDLPVIVGDPLSLEARVARIEDMVTDVHRILNDLWEKVDEIRPVLDTVTAEVQEKGLMGLMGAFMGMRR